MPRSEQMTRLLNASRKIVLPEFDGKSNPEGRGLINEAATRLAHAALSKSCKLADLSDDERQSAIGEAVKFIERFRAGHTYHLGALSADDKTEALSIGERLLEIFRLVNASPVMFIRVPGAGIIDSCDVDAIEDDAVFEIKAGNRLCRSEDIRQALVYAALLELSGQIRRVRDIQIVNPRLGWQVVSRVDSLLEMSGGKSWGLFRAEFENYVVEARHSHQVIERLVEPHRGTP